MATNGASGSEAGGFEQRLGARAVLGMNRDAGVTRTRRDAQSRSERLVIRRLMHQPEDA